MKICYSIFQFTKHREWEDGESRPILLEKRVSEWVGVFHIEITLDHSHIGVRRASVVFLIQSCQKRHFSVLQRHRRLHVDIQDNIQRAAGLAQPLGGWAPKRIWAPSPARTAGGFLNLEQVIRTLDDQLVR